MPSRHTVRNFYDGGFYHVFNRGVEKRDIFLDSKDYDAFLYYLSVFLSPKESIDPDHPNYHHLRTNYSNAVTLFSYCLMPNHFHLFIRQDQEGGVSNFMKALSNAYTEYFNKRHSRVGALFQGRYKAAHINSTAYYSHISRYIHLNPAGIGKDPLTYPYSSVRQYVLKDLPRLLWLDPQTILSDIGSNDDYRQFLNSTFNSEDIIADIKID